MHVETFVLLKPGLHCRVFVRGVVIHDQVQLKMFGCFSIDLFEKCQPLLMPVLVLDATDQASLKIVTSSVIARPSPKLRKAPSSCNGNSVTRLIRSSSPISMILPDRL